MGQGKHLKLGLDSGPGSVIVDAIAFRKGELNKEIGAGTQVDVVCHLEANEWQGRQRLQLNVQDLRVSE